MKSKRIISGITALMMVFGANGALSPTVFPVFSACVTASAEVNTATSGICGENLTWSIEDGVLTISGTGSMTDYEDKSSPFYNRTDIGAVTIKNGVTSIGDNAFKGCTKLAYIYNIPSSVTSIGEEAFYGCTGLMDITIPNSVTSIGDYAFNTCTGLTGIKIPSSVTRIGKYAFGNCINITEIDIPDSVTSIGQDVFYNCTKLASVKLPNGITEIDGLFYGCTSLTSVVIPDSVTTIGYTSFSKCENLKEITFPQNLEYIGSAAFADCHNLKKIDIPDGVTRIYYGTFLNCYELEEVTIPDNVTTINYVAFENCQSLTSITIPDSVTTMEHSVFCGCENLKSVKLSNNLTKIDEYTFACCYNLKSITIPKSVKEIEPSAFEHDIHIKCYRGSYAEQFAKENGFNYEIIKHEHPLKDVAAKDATCDKAGNDAYWYCPTCDKYFSDEDGINEITKASTVKNPIGHAWGQPTYTWSNDYKTCTATRVCKKDAKHIDTETVTAKSSRKIEPTCTTKGTTTYTAEFENSAFAKQTKDVQDISAKEHAWGQPTYTWSADNTTVTAKRVCKNDAKHVETETAKVKSSQKTAATCAKKGTTTYTAEFKNNAFAKQTKDIQDIPKKEHSWSEWKVTKPATEDAEGVETRECTVCHEKQTRAIPKLEKKSSSSSKSADSSKAKSSSSSSKPSNDSTIKNDSSKTDSKSNNSTESKNNSENSMSDIGSKPSDNSETDSIKPDDSSKPDSKPSDGGNNDDQPTDGEDETIMLGDVNGDGEINVTDIAKVAAHIKGIKALDENGIKAADVNGDGEVNVTDIAKIAAHIKGIKAIG